MANGTLTWLGHVLPDRQPRGETDLHRSVAQWSHLPRCRKGSGATTSSSSRTARRSCGRCGRARQEVRGPPRRDPRASRLARRPGLPGRGERRDGQGGTVEVDGLKFTLTNAFHSSSTPDGTYAGEPPAWWSHGERLPALPRRRHVRLRRHAADRAHLRPDLAILPIGDHYTMGPREPPWRSSCSA